jgi:hypothetical protein
MPQWLIGENALSVVRNRANRPSDASGIIDRLPVFGNGVRPTPRSGDGALIPDFFWGHCRFSKDSFVLRASRDLVR